MFKIIPKYHPPHTLTRLEVIRRLGDMIGHHQAFEGKDEDSAPSLSSIIALEDEATQKLLDSNPSDSRLINMWIKEYGGSIVKI